VDTLTDYERQQLQHITKWRHTAPSAATRTFSRASNPASRAIGSTVPAALLRRGLELLQSAAERIGGRESVLRRAGVDDLAALRAMPLQDCDRLAARERRRGTLAAGGSGTALGFAGVPGMIADLPTLLLLTFRSIHRIGLCYGEDCSDERGVTLAIFAIASANSAEEKHAALLALDMQVAASEHGWREGVERATERELAKSAAQLSLNNLARQIARRLGWRLSGAALPVLGAAIGGGVNAWFLHEAGMAATRSFQLRWLHARYPQLRKVHDERPAATLPDV
jgi:hypothetical protein